MSKQFKVIVCGTRDFQSYETVKEVMDKLLKNINDDVEIISGGANGADLLGERYAIKNGYKITTFKPDWVRYGNSACPKRNKAMVEYADACVCFWDGVSRGTKSTIKFAKDKGIPLRVCNYKDKIIN